MDWIALLMLLLPLIEALLNLFNKNTHPRIRKLIRARLDACNEAVAEANPTPVMRRANAKLLKRLDAANAKAKELGI